MILADYIAIGLVVLSVVVGAVIGFGKGLRFFTKGIFGILISAIASYFLLGIVLNIGFVQELLFRFTDQLVSADNAFCDFLLKVRIEIITIAVVLFILILILKKVVVSVVEKVMETDNVAVKVINKVLGAILNIAVLCGLTLIAMQITFFSIGEQGTAWFDGSFLKLDYVYYNNPLTSLIKFNF